MSWTDKVQNQVIIEISYSKYAWDVLLVKFLVFKFTYQTVDKIQNQVISERWSRYAWYAESIKFKF